MAFKSKINVQSLMVKVNSSCGVVRFNINTLKDKCSQLKVLENLRAWFMCCSDVSTKLTS